jgi:hypothetical protein
MLTIKNLSKEIDMTAVHGGSQGSSNASQIIQGQVVAPIYNVHSAGPVNIVGDVSANQYAAINTESLNGFFFSL